MATNAMPPAANGGSVGARPREDRAKLTQLVPETFWLEPSAVTPAEDPFGRMMAAQPPPLTWMESPAGPPRGLSASQLHTCVAVTALPTLKSAPSWSSTFWVVSEPTPVASFRFGAGVTDVTVLPTGQVGRVTAVATPFTTGGSAFGLGCA